jgi:hypothetical protein
MDPRPIGHIGKPIYLPMWKGEAEPLERTRGESIFSTDSLFFVEVYPSSALLSAGLFYFLQPGSRIQKEVESEGLITTRR